jgi:hypothetical protein
VDDSVSQPGSVLDGLHATQTNRVREALADRVRLQQRADGVRLLATALLGVANG